MCASTKAMLRMADKPRPITTRAHCPECDGERVCLVHGVTKTSWDWSDNSGNSMNGGSDHSLLQCRGCETVFYEISAWDSEAVELDYDYDGRTVGEYTRTKITYPKPASKAQPPWMASMTKHDAQLGNILTQIYVALDSECFLLSAVGLRTALDRATELLGIDPAKTFEEKLEELRTAGWVGDTEQEILSVITNAGNAAAHRGWQPDASQMREMVAAMEVFLQKAFIVEKKALKVKDSIPPKPKRASTPSP